jgi:hypothetical protein
LDLTLGFGGVRPERDRKKHRLLASVATVGVHAFVFAALFLFIERPSSPVKPSYVPISMIDLKTPHSPEAAESEDTKPEMAIAPTFQPSESISQVVVLDVAPVPDVSDILSESQLAGAASAGEASLGGGECDTAGLLQRALRRDPLVRQAMEDANRLGKSVMLWNGDWVQTGGQEGKGLAVIRQAVMWEVAFTPTVCRNKPMHGLVLLSLSDGDTRFAIGDEDWRWSDLLVVPGTAPAR